MLSTIFIWKTKDFIEIITILNQTTHSILISNLAFYFTFHENSLSYGIHLFVASFGQLKHNSIKCWFKYNLLRFTIWNFSLKYLTFRSITKIYNVFISFQFYLYGLKFTFNKVFSYRMKRSSTIDVTFIWFYGESIIIIHWIDLSHVSINLLFVNKLQI